LKWTIEWSILSGATFEHGTKDMRVSVTDAKGQLTELVRRAEAGDEVVLTRHGHAAVRLVPVKADLDPASRRALLEAARTSGSSRAKAGPDAARSQDFLYGDDGLPE
jgi:prevent-host-death family protein